MNFLNINLIAYIALLIPIYGIYTYAKWGSNKLAKNFGMSMLDVLPALLLLFYNITPLYFKIFIIGVSFANIVITRADTVLGAILYAITYFIGFLFLIHDQMGLGNIGSIFGYELDWEIVLGTSLIILATAGIWLLHVKKVKLIVKVGGFLYGLLALVPLFYSFGITFNFGFLSLVIGDVLLGVQYLVQINGKSTKVINYISNMFFYTGVLLAPLSLITW